MSTKPLSATESKRIKELKKEYSGPASRVATNVSGADRDKFPGGDDDAVNGRTSEDSERDDRVLGRLIVRRAERRDMDDLIPGHKVL